MDRTERSLVEVVPGKVSGFPLLRGTVYCGQSSKQLRSGISVGRNSDNFDLPEQAIRELLTYAANKQNQPQP